MANFSRLEVLNAIIDIGVVPLFYLQDREVAGQVIDACLAGGARVIEFTNRGDFAFQVFTDLAKEYHKNNSPVILGAGSVIDAPTAAIYINSGANFIVSRSY